eukprot:m.887741 g.887741  ORF g.887741 m.887741 type:complete len:295 (-) comp23636_c0_seq35:1262-2146(-)
MYHPTRRGPRSDCFRPRARSFAAAILMVQGIPSQEASPTTSGALTHPRPHAHIWVCTYAWTHSPTQRAIHAASHAIDHRPPLGQVHKREAFSRGRGLEYGVNEAPKRATPESTLEEVLFFCDIDMHFTYEFLYRCKANAIPGDSLYFPISFSLFKGKSVQVVHENGDWRTYGLGMVCISTTDFLASKGFSKTITGWGREDVDFYEHMLKNTSLTVLRSVDEGLVHIWHPKECNQAQLSADQFSDCVQSRADWEGDKLYLSRKLASYENVYGDIDFESARNSTTIRAAVTKAKHQ